MQASPAADHVGSMNARLIFRQEAVNDAGAAQPRMPEFDTWVLLRKSVAEISCFCQRKRALPVHDPLFSSRRQKQLDSLGSRQGIEFGQDALDKSKAASAEGFKAKDQARTHPLPSF
jgi:hypothetical protein